MSDSSINLNSPAAQAVRLAYCEKGLALLTEIVDGQRKVTEAACKTLALQQEALLHQKQESERIAADVKTVQADLTIIQRAAWMFTGGWKAVCLAAVVFVGLTKLLAFAADYLPKLVK